MSNMSYCRFKNTEIDLQDCIDAMEEDAISSDSEWEAMLRMKNKCEEFIDRADCTARYCEEENEDD